MFNRQFLPASLLIFGLLALSVGLPFSLVLAQTETELTQVEPVPFAPEVASLCTAYFDPSSIILTGTGETGVATPGTQLILTGEIENKNPVAIADASLIAKIYRQVDPDQKDSSRDIMIDQVEGIATLGLAPNAKRSFSYSWPVPITIEQGTYYVEHSLYVAGRQLIAGDATRDGVSIGDLAFTAGGADAGSFVTFSKSSTQVNGQVLPDVEAVVVERNADVTVTTELVNASAIEKTVTLQWLQYAAHNLDEKNLRYTKTEVVTIPAGERKDVTYLLVGQLESKVHVVAQVQDGDSKRLLNIPIVRSGGFEIETTFAGLSNFPIKNGDALKLVACVQSPYVDMTPDTRIEMTLRDSTGTVLTQYDQTSILLEEQYAFVHEYTGATELKTGTLEIKLLLGGGVVEEYALAFDCTQFADEVCGLNAATEEAVTEQTKATWLIPVVFTVGGLFLLALLLFALRHLRKKSVPVSVENQTDNNPLLYK